MLRNLVVAGLPLLFATAAVAATPSPMKLPPPVVVRPLARPVAPEPGTADLRVGDPAPMFSYIGADGRWHRSEDLLVTGPVLLVFGAAEEDLASIESLRSVFADLGVDPVPVMPMATRSTAAMARRLGLAKPPIADPMCVIAGLYQSIDPANTRHSASYFVVDGRRIVRAMRHGALPPAEILLATSARSLGLRLPASALTGMSDGEGGGR